MMKNRNNKLQMGLLLCMVCLMIGTLGVSAAGESFNWYCMRRKDHKQPRAESTMQFIEKYDGYYIDKKHGDGAEEKVVYLTFDAGYENGNVAKVLDALKEEQVPGAFFILDNLLLRNSDLVKRMVQEGHLVCNHTMKHRDMTKVTDKETFAAELNGLATLFRETVGSEMAHYYRPPEGKFNESNLRFAKELDYKTVFWSFAYADWDNNHQMSPEKAKEMILGYVHNGAVLLLHPTSATNAAIIGEVIRELKTQGYRFGTLDELTAGA